MLRRVVLSVLLVCVLVIAAACGGGGGTKGTKRKDEGATAPSAPPDDQAVRNYGYAPSTDAAARFQPDVVVVSAGPAAIRSVSSDGVTYTLDGNADGVSKLTVGSIMLASSRAAGRVVALQDDGDNRIVTLAPVGLTDIVRDGTINVDTNVNPSAFTYQEIPDLPGKVSQPAGVETPTTEAVPSETTTEPPPEETTTTAETSAARVVTLPAVQLVAAPTLPDVLEQSPKIPVGDDWTVQPTAAGGQLGVKATHEGEKLKLQASLMFDAPNLHLRAGEQISGGSASSYNFALEGIKGLNINLEAGIASGNDNRNIKVEVPVKIDIPIPPGPETAFIPLDFKVEFTALVETALSGSNSTITATGKYGLDGPIGIKDGSVVTPSFSVKQGLIDNIGGVAIGVSGVVFALGTKVQAGIGTASLSAGPYGSITASLGLTNGSALGAALAQCKNETLLVSVRGGAGLSFSDTVKDALSKLLPPGTNLETDKSSDPKEIVKRDVTVPDVPLCKG